MVQIRVPDLGGLCERGLAQAVRLGRGCAVVQMIDLSQFQGVDILNCARILQDLEGNSFYWEHPSVNEGLATGGSSHVLSSKGDERFEKLATQVERLQQEAVCGSGFQGAVEYPLLVGGFSFFSEVTDDLWSEFGVARMILPKVALVRRGNKLWGMVQSWVETMDESNVVHNRLEEGLRMLSSVFQSEVSQVEWKNTGELEALSKEKQSHAWNMMVKALQHKMASSDLHKAVLTQVMYYSVCTDAYQVSARLRKQYPDCYCFCIVPESKTGAESGNGIFVGASPERLISFEGNKACLSALAGTASRGSDPADDNQYAQRLFHSAKDREEHRVVVDEITGLLSSYGEVSFSTEPCLMQLANVQHLHTPIVFFPRGDISPLTLLGKLHPTPAVGGYPREQALQAIAELEQFERGWFASPIGWLQGPRHGEFAVALRCGLLRPNQAYLFVGAGILEASKPQDEWHELQLKLQPMISAINPSL